MLDGLFHNHIKTEWKPKALDKIQALINNTEKNIKDLGVRPDQLQLQQVVGPIQTRVVWVNLLKECEDLIEKEFEKYPDANIELANIPFTMDGSDLLFNVLSFISMKNRGLFSRVSNALTDLLTNYIKESFKDSVTDLKLERFENLQSEMIKYTAQFIGNEKTSSLKKDLNLLHSSTNTNVCSISQFKTKKELVNHAKFALLIELRRVKQCFEEFKIENNETLLDENLHYSQHRRIFQSNLQGLQEKYLIIETIDEQMLRETNVLNIEVVDQSFHFVEEKKEYN
jgi:hypothetical protein